MVQIEDNYLEEPDFKNLQSYLTSDKCCWHFHNDIDYQNEGTDTFQFVHWFLNMLTSTTPMLLGNCEILNPIITKMKPSQVVRIKANLIPRTHDIIENSFHVDIESLNDCLDKLQSDNEWEGEWVRKNDLKIDNVKREGTKLTREYVVKLPEEKEVEKTSIDEKTSIYYVNTNNGYTKFETGEIVESVGNRMITFPSNVRHTGTSCSDEKIRTVINFNYISK